MQDAIESKIMHKELLQKKQKLDDNHLKFRVDSQPMNSARACRIRLNRQMANEKLDGTSISKRVDLSLKQSAGKIAFKNYAIDALYDPAGDPE
jgi:hypothetical protein